MENNISSFPSSLSSQPPHSIFTLQHPNATSDNNATECVQNASEHTSYISVGMLIGGIVLARSGKCVCLGLKRTSCVFDILFENF